VRIGCSIPRPIFNELLQRERLTGVYRTRIAASIFKEALVGAMVDRELKADGIRRDRS
jgi:hypothetical protein